MENHLKITVEEIHYGGDNLGHDVSMHFTFAGTRKVNGNETKVAPKPLVLKPKFNKETRMALRMPAKIYELPHGNPGNVFTSDVITGHIHYFIVEIDKSSDYADGNMQPITIDLLNLQPAEYVLEVPVLSYGGDHSKKAVFRIKLAVQSAEVKAKPKPKAKAVAKK